MAKQERSTGSKIYTTLSKKHYICRNIYITHANSLCCGRLCIQHLEKEYPGSNILLVTVTDDESRRIEQQSDEQTKAEAMEVLRKMFSDKDLPDATDILVPRWWSDRFFKGSFSNWPIGVDRYEYDLIRVCTLQIQLKFKFGLKFELPKQFTSS